MRFIVKVGTEFVGPRSYPDYSSPRIIYEMVAIQKARVFYRKTDATRAAKQSGGEVVPVTIHPIQPLEEPVEL